MKIAALVLAAGRSARMGDINKLLYPPQRPILRRVIDQLPLKEFAEVVVVTGHQADRVKQMLSDDPVRFVYNPLFQSGIASSIRVGLQHLQGLADGVLICLGDMPFVTADDYLNILACWKEHQPLVVTPTWNNQSGNPVFISSKITDILISKLQGDSGARLFFDQLSTNDIMRLPMPSNACLRDFDTPEEFSKIN